MLTRLVPCLLLKNGQLVRSEGFSFHQVVGNPVSQVERFVDWQIDELVYLDITRDPGPGIRTDHKVKATATALEALEAVAEVCFVPLTFGGGIRTVEDMRVRIASGADKVAINTAAVETPHLISDGADVFGSQAIVVSIDAKRSGHGWKVHTHCGKQRTGLDVVEWAQEAERQGAGELFLNSVDEDGMASGYDLPLIGAVSQAVGIPVVACGGVGNFKHLAEGIEAGASAVSAANIFHFTEHSTLRAKEVMVDAGLDVRLTA